MDLYSYDLQRDRATDLYWVITDKQTGWEPDTNAAEHEIIAVRGPFDAAGARAIQLDGGRWEDIEPQDDAAILAWAQNADLEQIAHLADEPVEDELC